MVGFIFRMFWRVLIFALTLGLTYLTIFVFFPWLDKRLPMVIAILLIYSAIAYAGIPALVRFWRIVFKPDHLPVYVTTTDGWAADPVNIVLVAQSRAQFMKSMRKAGWHTAEPVSLTTAVKMIYAILFNKSYPTAPFSNLYLFGRKHDVGFQIQAGDPPTPRLRHHVRFWRLREGPVTHQHHSFWQELLIRFLGREKQVWIGAATYDNRSIAIDWRNGQLTHSIDEDTKKERDYLIKSLVHIGAVKATSEIKAGEPLQYRGQTFGVNIVVDGYVKVIELKRQGIVKKIKRTIRESTKKAEKELEAKTS
jgi:hypothetical protein